MPAQPALAPGVHTWETVSEVTALTLRVYRDSIAENGREECLPLTWVWLAGVTQTSWLVGPRLL